jgi:hypothetical protein
VCLLPTCLSVCLPAYLPTYRPTNRPTNQPTYLIPTYTHLPCLPTCLPICPVADRHHYLLLIHFKRPAINSTCQPQPSSLYGLSGTNFDASSPPHHPQITPTASSCRPALLLLLPLPRRRRRCCCLNTTTTAMAQPLTKTHRRSCREAPVRPPWSSRRPSRPHRYPLRAPTSPAVRAARAVLFRGPLIAATRISSYGAPCSC